MKNVIFNSFLTAFLLCLTIIVPARPYAVVDGMHVLEGGCIFFHITVYDNMDTSNPSDDQRIGIGWIGTADCNEGISPSNGFLPQGDFNFNGLEEFQGLDVPSIDYSDMSEVTILEPLDDFELQVYPNPSTGSVSIDFEDYQPSSGFIYSLSGGIVKNFNIDAGSNNIQLSLEDLKSGVYVIALSDGASIVKATHIVE